MPSSVTQFKDLELHYDATAAVTVTFWTDLPGGTVTSRRSLTFPATTGREVLRLPFDDSGNSYALPEGRIFKVRMTVASGVLRLFGGILRGRRLGEYIDGTQGEIWETLELAF